MAEGKLYAVNVCDWMAHKDDFGLAMLLGPVADQSPEGVVQCEQDRVDSVAMVLRCEQDRAAAIVEIIRKNYKRHELRFYHGSGRTWKRV